MKNVFLILALILLAFLAYDYMENRDVVVYPNYPPTPFVQPQAPPQIILPAPNTPVPVWTPFYVMPTNPPQVQPPVYVTSTGPIHNTLSDFCRMNPTDRFCAP